ncbi:MAG: PGF-pre-PGF domain-containing protein [Candidatus Methanoperedens sp.]|nr:PGF-pre-PGF domain-containing protein [Candidatus Methanoperedens sp.]
MRLVFHEIFLFFLMAIIAGSTAIPTAIAAAVYPDRLPSNISAGQTFDIGVKVDPQGVAIAGAQIDISYDKSVLKINSITEGSLFKQYGATTIFNGGVIDNSLGRAVNIYVSIIGQKNVQIPGTFVIINFTALNSTNGPQINLENVRVVDPDGNQVYPAPVSTPVKQEKETGGSVSGAGGNSGENYTNIELIEKYDLYIYKNVTTSYRFKEQTNPIVFINITGNSNPAEITTSVEVLKNTSTLVKSSASGLVYKNVNIWAGYFGYATPDNIKHAEVIFRVPIAWMEANNINPDSIEMMRYDDGWQSLPTRKIGTHNSNILYESSTVGFSFFAINGKKSTGEIDYKSYRTGTMDFNIDSQEQQGEMNNYPATTIIQP